MSVFNSNSAEETRNFGRSFALTLRKSQVFALNGEVGCGKTEFVRGIIEALNPQITVSSPTFSIVNTYDCEKFTVHHFDFYRIKHSDELFETGFDECVSSDAVVFIEWADMYPEILPKRTRIINFKSRGETLREISFE